MSLLPAAHTTPGADLTDLSWLAGLQTLQLARPQAPATLAATTHSNNHHRLQQAAVVPRFSTTPNSEVLHKVEAMIRCGCLECDRVIDSSSFINEMHELKAVLTQSSFS